MLRPALRPLPLLVTTLVALAGCGLTPEELLAALRGMRQGHTTTPGVGLSCYSSADCHEGQRCSTERGDCLPSPGCAEAGGEACDAACAGSCEWPPEPLPAPGGACRSGADCKEGQRCTTERGECLPPPGCDDGEACPAVCYGTCEPDGSGGEACGSVRCGKGTVCCNASCGTCVPPGGFCTEQACGQEEPPTASGACQTDADCTLAEDYCGGCNCRALAPGDAPRACPADEVACFAAPCEGLRAACEAGRCVVRDGGR